MPRVTVAIPTYQRAELTCRAVRSVLEQSFTDLRVVVLDNHSTDGTAEAVEAIGDARVEVRRRPVTVDKRHNINDALRAGVDSELTNVLFSDDVMLPGNLERKVAFLDAHPECVLVHSAYQRVGVDGTLVDPHATLAGERVDEVETTKVFVQRSIRLPCRVWFSSALIRSEVAMQLELRDRDAPADDHRIWLEAALRGPIGYLDEPLTTLAVAAGSSDEGGLLQIAPDGSDYLMTLDLVIQSHQNMVEFLVDHDQGPGRSLWLRLEAARTTARNLVELVGDQRRLGRSRRQAFALVRRVGLVEPAVLAAPWVWWAVVRSGGGLPSATGGA